MNYEHESDNPLLERLWDAEERAGRLDKWLCVAVMVAAVCFVLAVLFYFGQPVCVPMRGSR